MNRAILAELSFFVTSFAWGVLLFFIYDCLLIFRNIIKHSRFVTAIEDFVFWIVSGVLIFQMMYTKNHGTIRWYFIIGLALGMIFYRNAISSVFVKLLTNVLKKIIAIIKRVFFIITMPFRIIFKHIQKFLRFIAKKCKGRTHTFVLFVQKRLKNHTEKVKIKREEKRAKKIIEEPAIAEIHKSPKGSFELIQRPEEVHSEGKENEKSKKKKKKKNRP